MQSAELFWMQIMNMEESRNEQPRLLLRYIIYQLLKSLKFMHSGQAVGFYSFQPICNIEVDIVGDGYGLERFMID